MTRHRMRCHTPFFDTWFDSLIQFSMVCMFWLVRAIWHSTAPLGDSVRVLYSYRPSAVPGAIFTIWLRSRSFGVPRAPFPGAQLGPRTFEDSEWTPTASYRKYGPGHRLWTVRVNVRWSTCHMGDRCSHLVAQVATCASLAVYRLQAP